MFAMNCTLDAGRGCNYLFSTVYILLKIIYSIDAKNILNIHEGLRTQKLIAKMLCQGDRRSSEGRVDLGIIQW